MSFINHETAFWLLLAVAATGAVDPVFSPATLTDAYGNTADINSTITWISLPSDMTPTNRTVYKVDEGLEPYYGIVNSFIDSVFAKGIPPGLIETAANGTMEDLSSSLSKYTSYFIGYLICIATGVLFILIFPISACCFCVCRCCGKCGGKIDQLEKTNGKRCRKNILMATLAIIVPLLALGSACLFLNNSNTSYAIDIFETTYNSSFSDLKEYVATTLEKIVHIASKNVAFQKDVLFRDFDNIDYLVGLQFRNELDDQADMRILIADLVNVTQAISAGYTSMTEIQTHMESLNTSLTETENQLDILISNLDQYFIANNNSNTTQWPEPRPSYAVNITMNTSMLPNVTTSLGSMDSASFNQTINEFETQLNDIPTTFAADANATINTLKTTIISKTDDIKAIVTDVEKIRDLVMGENETSNSSNMEKEIGNIIHYIQKYDKYRWYGGIAIFCVVVLTVVLISLGIWLGVIGSCRQKMTRGRSIVANLGRIFLMTSAMIVGVCSTLLMLLTLVTFVVGTPVTAFVCKPLTDLDYMDKVWTVFSDSKVGEGYFYMGDLVLDNKSIPLTFSSVLRDCQAGNSTMSSLKLDAKYDFVDLFNYTKNMDFEQAINSLTVNFTSIVTKLEVLDSALENVRTAVNINYAEFYSELSELPVDMDLIQIADDIDTYAALVDPEHTGNFSLFANGFRELNGTEYSMILGNVSLLNSFVADLESNSILLSTSIDSLRGRLYMTNVYILNNAASLLNSHLMSFTSRIFGVLESLKNFSLDAIQNKMGSCTQIWNVYETMLVDSFCYNIMNTFNGFWFSLGWCIFFFVLGLIFAAKLSKYFRFRLNVVSPVPGKKQHVPLFPKTGYVFNVSQFKRKNRRIHVRSMDVDW